MACRNMEKCEEVRKKFIEATYNCQIVCKHLDLASLDSVRTFAKDISESKYKIYNQLESIPVGCVPPAC